MPDYEEMAADSLAIATALLEEVLSPVDRAPRHSHSSGEYVRDAVHVNSVEGFNSRVRHRSTGGLALFLIRPYLSVCIREAIGWNI